jgi:hypothetical protein
MNTTIIYYSSNREDPAFEQKVIEQIKKVNTKNLPVISVTQKPMDFGENICVGDVGCSYLNEYRQILIGCERATTDYVFTVESDCLYPEGYFDFVPDNENVYRYKTHYVMWKFKGPYHPKDHSQASLCFKREFLITEIKKALSGLPEWSPTHIPFSLFPYTKDWSYFGGTYAVINIKTGAGVSKSTRLGKDIKLTRKLPYWGDVTELRKVLFNA